MNGEWGGFVLLVDDDLCSGGGWMVCGQRTDHGLVWRRQVMSLYLNGGWCEFVEIRCSDVIMDWPCQKWF